MHDNPSFRRNSEDMKCCVPSDANMPPNPTTGLLRVHYGSDP